MTMRSNSMRFVMTAAILVAAVQTAVLLGIVGGRAAVLRNGTEILLKTAPVDPRDLLRGDYVILNYDIGRIPTAAIREEWPANARNEPLFVRIAPGADGFWTVHEASFGKLDAREGTVVLVGKVTFVPDRSDATTLSVAYGMERYYVPEGEGLELEKARNDGEISVAVRVSSSGVSHIRALLRDGKPVYEEPLY